MLHKGSLHFLSHFKLNISSTFWELPQKGTDLKKKNKVVILDTFLNGLGNFGFSKIEKCVPNLASFRLHSTDNYKWT